MRETVEDSISNVEVLDNNLLAIPLIKNKAKTDKSSNNNNKSIT